MLCGLWLVLLFAIDEVPVTVHVYNSFMVDEIIRAFLARYCSSVLVGEMLQGCFGFWRGKCRFLVRLQMNPAAWSILQGTSPSVPTEVSFTTLVSCCTAGSVGPLAMPKKPALDGDAASVARMITSRLSVGHQRPADYVAARSTFIASAH